MKTELRLVAWEVTRSCNLSCIHCRASARNGSYSGELTGEECRRVISEIRQAGEPVIILTGGEPLLRTDIFDIISLCVENGLPVVMGTNGTLLDESVAERLKSSGVRRISISIDGPDATTHDNFRAVPGAFQKAVNGIQEAVKVGMPVQINTTVTKKNISFLSAIMRLAVDLGAVSHHLFLLVPTGRGKELGEEEISADQYEQVLHWFFEQEKKIPLHLKATCAPQYYRILHQRRNEREKKQTHTKLDKMTQGCMGGISFCFISHIGTLQPCGYLELDCGNIRNNSFSTLWKTSAYFEELRDRSKLKGKCGICAYRRMCGGCRARAYGKSGDYLEEEPYCPYEPEPKGT